jgi:anti-anti-sigma factor
MERGPRQSARTVSNSPRRGPAVALSSETTASGFSILLRIMSGRLTLRIVGALDLATAPVLERALSAATGRVTIDARDLTFIDAHSLGVLVATTARTCVSVRHARPNVRRVFELCALAHLLDRGPLAP